MGLSGSRDRLLELFNRFENYPLLIRTLATPVAEYRKAPGDFDAWYAANPDVNPAQLPMVQVKSHVLAYAMHGLTAKQRVLLNTVAAFRAPTDYATIRDLVLEDQRGFFARLTGTQSHKRSLYSSEVELDDALRELEDRGLLGWDRLANRYDLHPIVRGVTWGGLDEDSQQAVYARLHGHFESVPDKHSSWREVESIEDLAPAIELYSTLIGLGRYDDACDLFDDRLDDATLYRLSASRQRIELLEMLFPAGTDSLPPLSRPDMQAYTLNALAQAYQFNGQPGLAAPLFRRNVEIREANGDNFSVGLCNLSDALRLAGGLHEAEGAARRALHLTREQANHFLEAASLDWLGLALAALGRGADGRLALRRARHIFQQQNHRQMEGVTEAYLAQAAIWANDLARARRHANRAWELAPIHRVEGDFIRSARLQGEAAVHLNDPDTADERLHHALTRARAVNRAEDELPALVALAEMYRRQGDVARAREMLSDVWEGCERGPYPPFHADGLNALARLEQDAGNPGAAVEAATAAYQKAWCDGPPYAYHSGLENAKALLTALGAPLPEMPPFDPAKFEPMVEVEVNPRDEFYVAVDDES
jgi:tetratricopeptide (TPR) repeat protein